MQRIITGLLGGAAALTAVAGAQAADLPVKAKPVEYVKVCSLYGAGFWYVPGTDTCLKVGSYIRTQAEWGASDGGIPLGAGNAFGRTDRVDNSDFAFRSRQALSLDIRTQTEYGTLRSYLEVGAQVSTAGNSTAGTNGATADAVFVDRGFVQFAGFTVGRVRSYFDINSFAPYSYANSRISGDTGALGIVGWAYTAQFGNGVTGTLSFEDPGIAASGRGRFTVDAAAAPFAINAATTYDNRGAIYPDVVGSLRIDQAWGYAQVAAALHDVAGGYYGTPNLVTNGHPDDKVGWAVTAGFTLNNVLGLKGDQFGMQAAFTEGAIGYVTRATSAWQVYDGSSAAVGWLVDGIFDTGGNIQLTQAWGINGFYQHFWNPKWRTSLYGGYVAIDYNGTAKNIINSHLPGGPGNQICNQVPVGGAVFPPVALPVGGGGNSCTPNFSWWQVGSRTQWNPHPDLDIGVDVLYTRLNTAYKGSAVGILPVNGARTAATSLNDQDILTVMFRVQRNFLP